MKVTGKMQAGQAIIENKMIFPLQDQDKTQAKEEKKKMNLKRQNKMKVKKTKKTKAIIVLPVTD